MRGQSVLSIMALLLLLVAGLLGGCSSGKKEGAEAPVATPTSPGNVQSAITAVDLSGTAPVVTFSLVDQNGAPLSPTTSGLTVRFTIARIESDGNYRNYIASSTPGQPGFDTGGTFSDLGGGVYSYTFGTNIKDTTQTLGGLAFDPTLTHTVAAQIQRNIPLNNGLTRGNTFQQAVNPYFNFRPDGAAVTMTREIVAISNCNECHNKLGLHGGGRREIALCILCHYPGPTDPQSLNPIDMKSLIHKIHYGEKLPSNVAGGDYNIVGFNNITTSYKTVAYPFISGVSAITTTPIQCTKCHREGKDLAGRAFGRDVDRWKQSSAAVSSASRERCATCHDTTTFDGSTSVTVGRFTLTAVPHSQGPATDDQCFLSGCHGINGEYDASVQGSHTILEQSTFFTGINFRILSVMNAVPGKAPTVTFKITDDAGTVIAPSSGSFSIKFGYPTSDYTNNLLANFGQPFTQSLSAATDNGDGSFTVTFADQIPAGRTGTGVVGLEGRRSYTFPRGTANVGGRSVQFYVDLSTGAQITDPARQRRQVVDVNKCNVCHSRLSLHGANRVNSIGECVICHNADATDRGQRPADTPPGTEQAIDFKVMIHKIHTGENLVLSQPYIIIGFGGSTNDFSEVRYPQDRRNCLACHIDAAPKTYGIPLSVFVLGTSINTGTLLNDDSDNIRIPPTRSVCTACHDTATANDHAAGNTFGGTTETCAQCHTTGLTLGPDFAHVPVR